MIKCVCTHMLKQDGDMLRAGRTVLAIGIVSKISKVAARATGARSGIRKTSSRTVGRSLPMRANSVEPHTVIDTDICVIGGACAGLTAAICAAENGAKKVTIVEKQKRLGGTLGVCGGFFGVESPAQKRLGIHSTADECFADLIQMLYWNCDAKLVRDWMSGSGESVRWLESKGMNFEIVAPFQGLREFCRSTYHVCNKDNKTTGMNMLRALVPECDRLGVEVLRQTRAQQLLTDEMGRVVGVLAEQDGRLVQISARSTVIATGSIGANKELIARFYGEDYSDIQIMSRVPHNTGDGLVMAEQIGAKIGDLGILFIGPHNHGRGHSELTGMLIRRPHPLKVNSNGERFADEGLWTDSDFGWMLSLSINGQPGKICWIICDAKMINDYISKNEIMSYFEQYSATQHIIKKEAYKPEDTNDFQVNNKFDFYHAKDYEGTWMENLMNDFEMEKTVGRAQLCQTVDDIASWIGCDATVLGETISRYNMSCCNGYDADFLKNPRHLVPIETPPYYVFRGPSGIDTCIGGIHVNNRLQVIDGNRRPIGGLYAAGVCTSGWLNRAYAYYGSCLSFTLFSGRTAGARAAQDAE